MRGTFFFAFFLLTVKYISNGDSVLYHVIYARVDAKGKAWNRNTENKRVTWFSLVGLRPQRNPLRATSLLYKRIIQ